MILDEISDDDSVDTLMNVTEDDYEVLEPIAETNDWDLFRSADFDETDEVNMVVCK
jgi:hypothetical protein